MINLSQAERRIIRQVAGEKWKARPVNVVEGTAAPNVVGESYYWTTLSGKTRIRHPNAYRWPMWYHHSTLAVEVGEMWVLRMRRYSCWPAELPETLEEFALQLQACGEDLHPVDRLAQEAGFPYGSWRRDPEKRRRVAQYILARRRSNQSRKAGVK